MFRLTRACENNTTISAKNVQLINYINYRFQYYSIVSFKHCSNDLSIIQFLCMQAFYSWLLLVSKKILNFVFRNKFTRFNIKQQYLLLWKIWFIACSHKWLSYLSTCPLFYLYFIYIDCLSSCFAQQMNDVSGFS